MLIVDAFIVN